MAKIPVLKQQLSAYFFHSWNTYFRFLPLYLELLALFCFLFTILLIGIRIYVLLQQRNDDTIFLEITPPAIASQSIFQTEQLIRTLHSIGKQQSFVQTFLGRKKYFALELVSTKETGIRFLVAVRKQDAGIVGKNLKTYLPGIETRQQTDYLPPWQEIQKQYIIIKEWKLRRSFLLPLDKQIRIAEHDPLAYLANHFTRPHDKEIASFQIVLTPIHPGTHPIASQTIERIKTKLYQEENIKDDLKKELQGMPLTLLFAGIQFCLHCIIFCLLTPITLLSVLFSGGKTDLFPLWIFTQTKKRGKLTASEVEFQEGVKQKLNKELFETSIRLLLISENPLASAERTAGIDSTLSLYTSPHKQGLQMKRSIPFAKHNLLLQKRAFALYKQRTISLSTNPILSTQEIASIQHIPHIHNLPTEDIQKVLSPKLPVPLRIKNQTQNIVSIGKNTYGNILTPIRLTADIRSRHMFIIGQTGSGKSTILFHLIKADIEQGRGVTLIDPHGDLAEDVLHCIPENRINDVVYINPFDIKHPIRINLLERTPGLDEDEAELEKEIVAEEIISIFRRIFSKNENADAHRIEYILRNTIYTAFSMKDATIFTIYKILTNPDFRNKSISNLDNEYLRDFWKYEFGTAGDWQITKMISGITAKVGRFLFSPIAKRILEEPVSSINFDELLNQQKIIICNLSEGKLGEDTAHLLGTTIITKIHLAILRRARREKESRTPFYLYVDEFQNFATSSFTKLLSGGRKYGLNITIAEQSTTQQTDSRTTNVILANVGTVICFKTASPVDEELLLPQFSPQVKKGEIINLPRHHFYIRLGSVETVEPFSGETISVPVTKHPEKVARILAASRNTYATTYQNPEKRIETPNMSGEKKSSLV